MACLPIKYSVRGGYGVVMEPDNGLSCCGGGGGRGGGRTNGASLHPVSSRGVGWDSAS